MKKRLLGLLAAFSVFVTVFAIGATPASSATQVARTPNWWTCSSYDKVCLGTDISMDPAGRQLNVYSVGTGCINLTSAFNDAISSVDNAWNDAQIRITLFFHANCAGSSFYVGGNDAVNLNCCDRQIFNDNISSIKIECIDFLGQCYYGP
jgi:hypothetical protein